MKIGPKSAALPGSGELTSPLPWIASVTRVSLQREVFFFGEIHEGALVDDQRLD